MVSAVRLTLIGSIAVATVAVSAVILSGQPQRAEKGIPFKLEAR
jgi:hypothetical protein